MAVSAIDREHGYERGAPCARKPKGREWQDLGNVPLPGPPKRGYESGGVRVISSIQDVEAPDGNGTCLQWLISISMMGKRPKSHHVRRALRAFGMVGAENDTHHPGNAVHFWLVVDPVRRLACQCKADEDTIVDADGYRWTNPKPGEGECRGCEIAPVTGRACPIHGARRTA